MDFDKVDEDEELYDFFGHRYAYLFNLHKDVKGTTWRVVIRELRRTLEDYDTNSRDSNIDCIKNRKPIPRVGKRSMNCVAVCCALFCEKFRDLEIDFDISFITDSLHENITSMLSYLSHSMIAVRMVEIMLYTMFAISHDYQDCDGHWSSLLAKCFHNDYASPEIQIASGIIICELDKDKKYVDINMYQHLNNMLIEGTFFGFKEKNIKYAIHLIQEEFQMGFKIKDDVTEPRDSGFKTDSDIESGGSNSRDGRKGRGHHKRAKENKKQKKIAIDCGKESSPLNFVLERPIVSVFGGAVVLLFAIWFIRKGTK